MAGSPIQQFIEQYMQVQAFQQRERGLLEQQRQFDEQQALAQRQQLNNEMAGFSTLIGQVTNPNERTALVEYFSQRSPEQAPVFQQLADSVAASVQTQMNKAYQTLGPQFAERAAQVGAGTMLSAGQEQQGEQFGQTMEQRMNEFLEGKRQFGMTFGENQRQYNTSLGQRQYEFGENIGLQRADLAQRGALGQAGMMFSSGLGPQMLRGQLSEEAEGIRSILETQGPMMRPEARSGMNRQLNDITSQIGRFDNLIQAEAMRGMGDTGPKMSDAAAAWQDIAEADGKGERRAAEERYNVIARSLGLTPVSAGGFRGGATEFGSPDPNRRRPLDNTFLQWMGR